MSDYEATAYLSLEKLKVKDSILRSPFFENLGEAHAGIPAILG
jgi:hypothetical protein